MRVVYACASVKGFLMSNDGCYAHLVPGASNAQSVKTLFLRLLAAYTKADASSALPLRLLFPPLSTSLPLASALAIQLCSAASAVRALLQQC